MKRFCILFSFIGQIRNLYFFLHAKKYINYLFTAFNFCCNSVIMECVRCCLGKQSFLFFNSNMKTCLLKGYLRSMNVNDNKTVPSKYDCISASTKYYCGWKFIIIIWDCRIIGLRWQDYQNFKWQQLCAQTWHTVDNTPAIKLY